MREKRRMATPASTRATKASIEPMTSGYALVVDGHIKASFEAKDSALEFGRELKARFPHLQVKIFDAETKRSEAIAAGSCGPISPHLDESRATMPFAVHVTK